MVKLILRDKDYQIKAGMTLLLAYRRSQSIYYKELLHQLETTRPGAKLIFCLRFLEERKSGKLFIEKDIERAHLHPFEKCGQPISATGMCSFCRTMEKVNSVPAS